MVNVLFVAGVAGTLDVAVPSGVGIVPAGIVQV
jgi:hypothetical protein